MASSIVDEHLGEWLDGVTIEVTSEQHELWRSAVSAIAKGLDSSQAFGLVRAAFSRLDDATRDWTSDRIREHDGGFAGSRKDALLSTIAAAAVVEILDNARHSDRALVALLVRSARSAGLDSPVDQIVSRSEHALLELTRAERDRSLKPKPLQNELAKQFGDLTAINLENPDLVTTTNWVSANNAGLKQLAKSVSEAIKQLAALIALQDEELDMLWWSYGGLSTTIGDRWDEIQPIEKRVVLAASEFHSMLKQWPSPPSARALLSRAIGPDADTTLSLSQVARASVESGVQFEGTPDDLLLPIASSTRQQEAIGGEDDTWKKVLERTYGIDSERTWTPLDAAEQLILELDVCQLL